MATSDISHQLSPPCLFLPVLSQPVTFSLPWSVPSCASVRNLQLPLLCASACPALWVFTAALSQSRIFSSIDMHSQTWLIHAYLIHTSKYPRDLRNTNNQFYKRQQKTPKHIAKVWGSDKLVNASHNLFW